MSDDLDIRIWIGIQAGSEVAERAFGGGTDRTGIGCKQNTGVERYF